MPAGRKPSLTPELAARIVELVRLCHFRGVICQMAGVRERTLRRWLTKGSRATDGIYRKFYLDVNRAEGEAQDELLRTMKTASVGQPQWAAWILARRWPGLWGDHAREVRTLRERIKILEAQEEARNAGRAARPGEEDKAAGSGQADASRGDQPPA